MTVLPILNTVHNHWYLQELKVSEWTLDMKVEALVPTIIAILNPGTAAQIAAEVQTNITTDIRYVQVPQEENSDIM
jgi:hypothetical protein